MKRLTHQLYSIDQFYAGIRLTAMTASAAMKAIRIFLSWKYKIDTNAGLGNAALTCQRIETATSRLESMTALIKTYLNNLSAYRRFYNPFWAFNNVQSLTSPGVLRWYSNYEPRPTVANKSSLPAANELCEKKFVTLPLLPFALHFLKRKRLSATIVITSHDFRFCLQPP